MAPRTKNIPASVLEVDDVLYTNSDEVVLVRDILNTKDHIIVIAKEFTETLHPDNQVRKVY